MNSTSRSGLGALVVIVMVLLIAVAVMGVSQSFFSSHVVDKAIRSSLGNIALALAESAAQELLVFVQSQANDPQSGLYAQFRASLANDGDQGFWICKPGDVQADLPATRRLMEMPEFAGFVLEPTLVEVSYRRPLETMAYETTGLLRVATQVTSTKYGSITRGVEIYKDFKVQLAGPARPFDQLTFFCYKAESLAGGSFSSPNKSIEASYSALSNYLNDVIPKAKQAAEQGGSSNVGQRVAQLEAMIKPWVPPDIAKPPEDDKVWAHYFKEPTLVLTLEQQLPKLEELWLWKAMQASSDEIIRAADEVERAKQTFASNPSEETGLELCDKVEAAATKHRARLETVRKWQALFYEKSGGSQQNWVEVYLPKFDRGRMARKATLKVSSQRDFDDLFARLGSRINGVVFADCGLKIPAAWKGKAVIAATGPLELTDVAIEDKTRDQLTVVGYGEVRLGGARCDASIVVGPEGELSFASPVKIAGNLIFTGAVRRPEELKGALEYNNLLFSGTAAQTDKIDHLLVNISPQVRMRGVVRN